MATPLRTSAPARARLLAPLLLLATASGTWAQPGASARASAPSPAYGPPRGTLVIVGGGNLEGSGITERFIALAGGPSAKIVIVPTAGGNRTPAGALIPYADSAVLAPWRRQGLTNVHMLHTHDPKVADTEAFAAVLKDAKAVWFNGGRQWNLVDSYAGTRTYQAFHDVLARGGVIGGSSAGASIQGTFLVRGAVKGSELMIAPEPEHRDGFNFLRRSAIDQHINTRNRWNDLQEVLTAYPTLLGIGISEATAIVVQRDTFEVIGKAQVAIHDPEHPMPAGGKPYRVLEVGDRYDLKARRVLEGVPSPASILGWEPGTDRKLPTWKQVTDYFAAVDKASPRVSVRTLGTTTLGRPFIVAFISDSATLAALPRYQRIQQQLTDPRLRVGVTRDQLVAQGKNVILITSSIHSTEVGGFLTPLVLADRLARGNTAEARAILANTIIMLVPSQNPDGVDIVGDWYRSTLGTPAEGSTPPALYHYYTGHDNNRDWYAFTQKETRYTVDSLYTPWVPQIVNDVHQQGANAGRIFIPPYMDPVEPNIDPILTASTNALGMAMAWRMTADGLVGIATNASYDQWSPARQYSLNHRGARILTETASARLATAVELPFELLGTGRGYDAKVASWNFPSIWPGGRWGIGDIVRYQVSASWALLVQAARDRMAWLESAATMGERALAADHPWTHTAVPAQYVIPKAQRDPAALQRLLWTLQHGQVVVHESDPAGAYVVPVQQPFGSYAKALLEAQQYPNLQEYPGGPPKRPYDVTAHTLPLLFGVEVRAESAATIRAGAVVPPVAEPTYTIPGLSGASQRRIAIYQSWNASMDEGWTRWVFDAHRIAYTTVHDADLRAGRLRERFDAIILPDQGKAAIARGLGAPYPDSLRGGVGDAGRTALAAFVRDGGTLLAFNEASDYAIEALALPVTNVLAGVRNTQFYAPGSLLAVEATPGHPLAAGYQAPVPAIWFEDSPAFAISDSTRATAVLRYPATGSPLRSGWLLGGERLNGQAAMVEVAVGRGRVVLYGFRPQYRAQSNATWPLLWSALLR
jgi:cyanophycinase